MKEMKLETVVFDKIKKVLPETSTKTVLFANVSDTSYEIFFYSLWGQGEYRQCYELAENGILDAYLLDEVFAGISESIRADCHFRQDSINVFTFILQSDEVKMDVDYYDKSTKIYQVKKEWREKYLC